MASTAFGGVLAQPPAPYGMQPGMWNLMKQGMAPQPPRVDPMSAAGTPAAFHQSSQGPYGGGFDQTYVPTQNFASPYAPWLATGAGGMGGVGAGHGYVQRYPGPQASPLKPKNPEARGKNDKNKGDPAAAGQGDVAPADQRFLTSVATYGVPQGIPKGLEILAMVEGLTISQEVEALEAITNAFGIGYEGNNSYKILAGGEVVYRAVEDTNFFWRCFCTQLRPVHLKIKDLGGNQVLAFQRHFRLFPCAWFKPCRENVTVFYGAKEEGEIIGEVTQSCCGGCCNPQLNVHNKKHDRELIVTGPCIVTDCCGSKFDILTESGKRVGQVEKKGPRNLADIVKEITTDADEFQMLFPQDLKVETKASLLAALFVIDLLFFEFGGSTNRNLDGSCTIDLCVIFCCGWPVPCRATLAGIGDTGDKGTEVAPKVVQMDR